MKFKTKAIHSHQKPDSTTGALTPSIVTSVSFAQKSPGEPYGEFEYSRVSTPTRKTLESCFAELEMGKFAFAFASGCASLSLITHLLKPGDLVLGEEDLYGGSLRLLDHLSKSQGIKMESLDFSDHSLVAEKLKSKPRLILLESPTNPLLKIIDIKKIAELKDPSTLLVVDNTFVTPYYQTPLTLGADIVFHSATKYIGGHSDCLGGLLVTNREDLYEEIAFLNKTIGPVLSPFDSYLLLRSLKTLGLRMDAHSKNALEVAKFLESHNKVEKVLYPGLKSHPQFELAKKQMSGSGGVVSFYLKGGGKSASKFLQNLNLILLAESLGAVESLAEQPLTMTHQSFQSRGVTEGLIRFSVGIEHIDDLIKDLDQALKNC